MQLLLVQLNQFSPFIILINEMEISNVPRYLIEICLIRLLNSMLYKMVLFMASLDTLNRMFDYHEFVI